MTSGNFHSLALNVITVDRESRQRRQLTRVEELAESIGRLGLIHPITVTREGVLVAGERRLEAVRLLGWTHLSVQYVDELEPAALRAIELEENIKRLDIPWQDQVKAVLEYHNLRKATEVVWNREKTAEALGIDVNTVYDQIAVAEEIKDGNARVIEAPKYSTAKGVMVRTRERKKANELSGLKEVIGIDDPPDGVSVPDTILNVDFREWVKTYDGPKFNFIHCDFPYGIGADKFHQSSAPAFGDYDDSEETYFDLLNCLLNNLDRLATESCHIMFWFSMHHYGSTLSRFDDSNFVVDSFPLVWMKSDGSGIIPDPSRGTRRTDETCLFGARGDRKIVQAVANSYAAPAVRDRHMSEKNQAMLSHFFRMFVDEHTLMLDPTCGSGSAVRAAEAAGAKLVVGLEINAEFAALANEALERDRRLRKVA